MQALLNAIAGMHNTVDAHRVFHGRGGVYPDCAHWTLDWFAPVWVLTSFKVVTPEELSQCHEALQTRWQTLDRQPQPNDAALPPAPAQVLSQNP